MTLSNEPTAPPPLEDGADRPTRYEVEELAARLRVRSLERAARRSGRLVVEDHRPEGGVGDAVTGVLAERGAQVATTHLAVRTLPGSAARAEQRALAGIDADAIVEAAR